MRLKNRVIHNLIKLTGLHESHFIGLNSKDIKLLRSLYKRENKVKYRTRQKAQKLKDCWGVR